MIDYSDDEKQTTIITCPFCRNKTSRSQWIQYKIKKLCEICYNNHNICISNICNHEICIKCIKCIY